MTKTMRLIVFLLKAIIHIGQEKGIDLAGKLYYCVPKYKRPYMRVFDQQDSGGGIVRVSVEGHELEQGDNSTSRFSYIETFTV